MKAKMVSVAVLLALAMALTGCAWLNPLNRLEVGTYRIATDDNGPTNPDWLDNESVIAVSGPDSLTEFKAASFAVLKEHSLDLTDATEAGMIAVSPDATRVAFNVTHSDDHSDIVVVDLTTDAVTTITDGASEYHGASFLSDTKLVYVEYDHSVTAKVTNRIITYNLSTAAATTIVENTVDYDGTTALGDTVWWGSALAGNEKVLVCASDYAAGTESFKVFNTTTGELLFNGFDFNSWDEVKSGDWIDPNTVIIPAGSLGTYTYSIIDISTPTGVLVTEIPFEDPPISRVWGVRVSPDGTLAASQYAEHDSSGVWVTNGDIITRIAAAE